MNEPGISDFGFSISDLQSPQFLFKRKGRKEGAKIAEEEASSVER
jgi:hypothetical protein